MYLLTFCLNIQYNDYTFDTLLMFNLESCLIYCIRADLNKTAYAAYT
jgi:hypothetical protein